MNRSEPDAAQEQGLALRTDLLARLMQRLRTHGFDVGVEFGGAGRPSWEPWLVIPGLVEISCEVSDGPLFTIGPDPFEFAEDIDEAVGVIRAR